MQDIFARIAHDMVDRVSGPMKFRLVLQPLMAMFFAFRDGMKDARDHKPAYFWSLFSDRAHTGERLREGWRSVGKIFILAVVLDCIYQIIEIHRVYPFEALIVAVILAIVPYVLLRGVVTRIARRLERHE